MARGRRAAVRKPEVEPENDLVSVEPEQVLPRRGLVFISHDSRDADLAEAFANLLTDVSAGILKSFRASDRRGTTGIPFGTEWYKEIMDQLNGASDVVALLTPQSIERPWILYEAGVAKGKLNTTVFGVALGAPLDAISTGPFAQFQNCGDDEDSLTKLVMQLLSRNPDTAPREEAVRMQVSFFINHIKDITGMRGSQVESKPTSDSAKLFEEVKEMVRALPNQIEDKMLASRSRSRKRRFHPLMFDELMFGSQLNRSGEVALLVLVSIVRDEMPWIYEPGVELYRAIRSGSSHQIAEARKQLSLILEVTRHPMFFELRDERDDDMIMIMHEIPRLIEHALHKIEARPQRVRARLSPPVDGPEA